MVSTYESARHILNNHTHKGGAARALYYPGTPRTIVTAEGARDRFSFFVRARSAIKIA